MKLLSKENIARNYLIEKIAYDKEMQSLRISISPQQLQEISRKTHLSIEELYLLRKEMNQKLKKCLNEIDGYPH